MLKVFFSIVKRDLKLYFRNISEFFSIILFFILITGLFFFIITDQYLFIKKVGVGVIWINVLLSILLSLEGLFRFDYSNGLLEQFLLSSYSLSFLMFSKMVALWIANFLPIVLIAPILSIFFGLVFDEIFVLFVSLLLGTPILTIIGMIGVSSTLVLYRGGVLLTIILIPLYIPVLIFGISSVLFFIDGSSPLGHFSILIVLNIVFLFLGPFAIASSLRVSCFI